MLPSLFVTLSLVSLTKVIVPVAHSLAGSSIGLIQSACALRKTSLWPLQELQQGAETFV